ncbi:MAG: hypothetical protein FWD01_03980 [Defluviitaleaceae bacterium]|nr:hypothetical protein [Defluviitaleaceae bacterium]
MKKIMVFLLSFILTFSSAGNIGAIYADAVNEHIRISELRAEFEEEFGDQLWLLLEVLDFSFEELAEIFPDEMQMYRFIDDMTNFISRDSVAVALATGQSWLLNYREHALFNSEINGIRVFNDRLYLMNLWTLIIFSAEWAENDIIRTLLSTDLNEMLHFETLLEMFTHIAMLVRPVGVDVEEYIEEYTELLAEVLAGLPNLSDDVIGRLLMNVLAETVLQLHLTYLYVNSAGFTHERFQNLRINFGTLLDLQDLENFHEMHTIEIIAIVLGDDWEDFLEIWLEMTETQVYELYDAYLWLDEFYERAGFEDWIFLVNEHPLERVLLFYDKLRFAGSSIQNDLRGIHATMVYDKLLGAPLTLEFASSDFLMDIADVFGETTVVSLLESPGILRIMENHGEELIPQITNSGFDFFELDNILIGIIAEQFDTTPQDIQLSDYDLLTQVVRAWDIWEFPSPLGRLLSYWLENEAQTPSEALSREITAVILGYFLPPLEDFEMVLLNIGENDLETRFAFDINSPSIVVIETGIADDPLNVFYKNLTDETVLLDLEILVGEDIQHASQEVLPNSSITMQLPNDRLITTYRIIIYSRSEISGEFAVRHTAHSLDSLNDSVRYADYTD